MKNHPFLTVLLGAALMDAVIIAAYLFYRSIKRARQNRNVNEDEFIGI